MNSLETAVAAWRESADRIVALGEALPDDEWGAPTDCPGWTVGDIFAHLAHLESLFTAEPHPAEDYAGPTTPALMPEFTEAGVDAYRGRSPAHVRDEFAAATTAARTALTSLPADPDSIAPVRPPGTDWSWRTLLRNRAIDMFVHEQDLRRALHRPGGWDGAAAQFTLSYFLSAMPFVVGKRIAPPARTSVVWRVRGTVAFDGGVVVGTDGRARTADPLPADPTVGLEMTSEDFLVLCAGRRPPADVPVETSGDVALAAEILAAMRLTP